ncbi:hypothetical protein FIL70_02965 [Sphingobium fuliginis ATCC 27551]|uniref:Uncharacterized protein n=1 Tax=Sphingobium fuliginis ATCC 27551 TaxID=1208342 RepID=A0A5B8CED6_SPHSA|nr:hypothetical protein FIL70_02965 [Sphingobium fuliginis ATCC 27551]
MTGLLRLGLLDKRRYRFQRVERGFQRKFSDRSGHCTPDIGGIQTGFQSVLAGRLQARTRGAQRVHKRPRMGCDRIDLIGGQVSGRHLLDQGVELLRSL